ncbi:MAG: hypothetical protein ACHQD9_06215 [Chitinophagales bacterium]
MKLRLFLLALSLPVFSTGQISCPAFGRMQNYEKFELLLTWNTVDPYPEFAGIDLQNDVYQTGDYKNLSVAPGITFNYYADENTVLRVKGIYTHRNVKQTSDFIDTLGNKSHVESQLEQTLFKIAPGFEWTYFVQRFCFYGGFEIPYTYQSDFTITETAIDSIAGTANTVQTNATTTIPGGFSIGLGCFAGSTFYFPKILGVGFEIASAYQYTKLGGTIKTAGVTTDNPPVVFSSEYFDQKTLWRFSPLQASLHLSIRF